MMLSVPRPPKDLSLSPQSKEKWDVSLQSLANGLSQICRPASPGSPPTISPNPSPTGTLNSRRSPTHPVGQCSSSQLTTVQYRKVRVRHQESTRSLQEQLLAICGARRQEATQDTLTAMEMEKQRADYIRSKRPLMRRESYKMAFRLKVNVSECNLPRLSVSLCNDVISVQTHGTENKVLGSDELFSDLVEKETIMCVFNDGELDVKQYPQKYLKMEYPAGAVCYFPIMQEDDVARTWRMSLLVPGCYGSLASNLQVKTLDYKLVITWYNSKSGAHKLSIDVPHNVVTQTICGGITEYDTLVLEAQLGATRDRCLSF